MAADHVFHVKTVFYEIPASNYLLTTLRLKLNNITKAHVLFGSLFRACKQAFSGDDSGPGPGVV